MCQTPWAVLLRWLEFLNRLGKLMHRTIHLTLIYAGVAILKTQYGLKLQNYLLFICKHINHLSNEFINRGLLTAVSSAVLAKTFVRAFYNIFQKNLWPTFWPTAYQAVWRGNSKFDQRGGWLFHNHCDKAKLDLRPNKTFHTVLVWFANETRTQWDKMTQELASSPAWLGPAASWPQPGAPPATVGSASSLWSSGFPGGPVRATREAQGRSSLP